MFRAVFSLGLLLFSFVVGATGSVIKVAVNIGQPWAFYEDGQGVVGIDVDIIRSILTAGGYSPEFHLLAYNRLIKDFNAGKFDIASPAAFPSEFGHLTDAYLPFKDVAISLKSSAFSIHTISDLKDKNIVAYQFAKSVLGNEFAQLTAGENYAEFAEREIQLKLLVGKKADVVIGEKRLLSHIMQTLYPQEPFVVHPIFATRSYGAITNSQALKDLFNRELAKMRLSGSYQRILQKWP